MKEDFYYLIDKDRIKINILNIIKNNPMNLTSIIDGRGEFYGLGYTMLDLVEKYNIKYIFVDSIKEALKIRKINSSVKIIIRNIDIEMIYDSIVNNFIVSINDLSTLNSIEKLNLRDDLEIIFNVNVGLNIEGINDVKRAISSIEDMKHIKVIGAYTILDCDNKIFDSFAEEFDNKTYCMNKENIKFIVSKNEWNKYNNYFGKNVYCDNKGRLLASLNSNVDKVVTIDKKESFLNKKKNYKLKYGIVNIPFMMNVKRVVIGSYNYKVIFANDYYLIININDKVKKNDKVEILGNKSKNYLYDQVLIKNIAKYYQENGDITPEIEY